MDLSGRSGSCFNQHKDAFENGLPPMKNETFSYGDGEISSPSVKAIQYTTASSSAGLDAPASGNCIQAQDGWENRKSSVQEIFAPFGEQIEETDNQILSRSAGEVDGSFFVRGKQIASADYKEIAADSRKDFLRNEAMASDEYGGQECGEEEIKSEASSCNDKGFSNACESVGQDRFGPHSSREIEEEGIFLTSTRGIFHRGAGLVQEAVVEPNTSSAENLDSAPAYTFSTLRLRNTIMNYVHESTKFIASLAENLLRLLSVSMEWASQALVKPRIIPTLVKMDKNEMDNFASGVASTIEPHGSENIYTEDLVGAIGFHLGMSIATVLAEILASNYCLKQDFAAEEISELLGIAIKESLNKDLGSQCNHLVRDFEAAFTSTYKTIVQVKKAHYEKKMTSCISEKNTLISGDRMPGLATKGSAKNTQVEYADTLENPDGKIREKTDCEWLVEQTSGSLVSEQGSRMKDEVQQFHKLRFTKSDVQITSNDKDNLPKENYRVNCQECSCITENLNVKDLNNLICQTNQCLGNVLPSHSEMGVVKNEIEELGKKLENLMSDPAECKDLPMGNNPSVATNSTACTSANIEKNNSDLANAINENGIQPSMSSASLNQQIALNGQFERQPGYTTSCITESFNVKDLNNLTCQTNQCLGNVLLSHSEMGIVNNEIEELSQKLENLMSDSAGCEDLAIGNNPFVATDTTICTGVNLENNNSDLPSAINENGIPSSTLSASPNQQIVLNGQFERQPGYTSNSIVPLPEWTRSMSNVFEKSLMEQERCNKLREVEIELSMRHLRLKEKKMYVDAESNKLKRQSIALNQSKASFSESKFIDKKLNNAYVDLNRTCADHLVAGLMLMLLALAYGSWKYSHVNISQKVQSCHDFSKESQKSSWFYNPVNSMMAHIQTLMCEIIVIGRMLFGLAVIVLISSSLLRRTVSSSSQTMPTSIILIVLGLLCGYAGKLSVESLGGSGFCWLVQWEAFCLLHAFSAYSPASVLHVLNGPLSTHEVKEKLHMFPFSLRKFIFHTLLFVLPVMAGLTPFASVREWKSHFSVVIFDNILVPVRTIVRDNLEQFLGV